MRALLDTHVLVEWFATGTRLSAAHQRVIRKASPESPLWVSDISLWEIATLASLGRIDLSLPLRTWLERVTAPPLVQRIGISPAVAAEVAALPPTFHRDPADRILVASARVLGATLLTRDQRICDARIVPTLS
ncbi:MAG TPA: type II toxin-antitoxin system VapC family toxin [Thermoanaerobaculia bacterium]|nr:type II toxin-antitoxin system VapC family toxin [Thermoanaerobaculia bacterium]